MYTHIMNGKWELHRPWDGRLRASLSNIAAANACSAFRTFQGLLCVCVYVCVCVCVCFVGVVVCGWSCVYVC